MEQLTLKLSEIRRPERNIRIHTEKQLVQFERSVRMFGQLRPLVVDETNTVLAGNGLLDTLERLGYEEALVYKFTDLTENQKKKLMIADNKIYSLGIENLDTLNSFLEEMKGDLDIPGFDEEILEQMVADTEEITEKLSEYGTLAPEEVAHIRENTARQEQRAAEEQKEPVSSTEESPNNTNPIICANTTTGETDGAEADIKKFVICPSCGEKIWL